VYNTRSFGSADDEVLKKLFHNSGFLYLGGDYHGATAERSIGNNKFVNIGTPRANLTRAYMTYLTDLDLLNPSDSIQDVNMSRKAIDQNKQDSHDLFLKAYPNPFKDELMITVGGQPGKCLIKTLDILGNVMEVQANDIPASGSRTINMTRFNQLPSGVYFIQATLMNGQRQSLKVVKE
jgi:hypothetical protein